MPWWWESEQEKQLREAKVRSEKQRKEAQAATAKALERGEIPLEAKRRLQMQKAKGDLFFSSDLTSNEHLLTREAGYQPIGLVMGTAFYKVSFWGYFNS
ncbi:MAG: hypothetical protein NVS2B14_19500 [Chamaesiphon sp.]